METVRVELWYTDDLLAEYGFSDRTPKYTLVHTYEHEYDAMYAGDYGEIVCMEAWGRFNRGSGDEESALMDEKKMRSLSMGDIVKIVFDDGVTQAFCCASAGWRAVESWEVASG